MCTFLRFLFICQHLTLLESQGWDPRKELEAKKYLYGEASLVETLQTQSGRLKGTASIDVTGLKESAEAPRKLLLVHSPTPTQFLPVPC